MPGFLAVGVHVLLVFYASLCTAVKAADEPVTADNGPKRRGYTKGELVPVSCLNRTIDTGEHVRSRWSIKTLPSYQRILSQQPLPSTRLVAPLTSPRTQITDSLGNLQYIPFATCNETLLPLSFPFATPQTQTCTIDSLPDELYHLLEFFVHSDVPLSCRIPSYTLTSSIPGSKESTALDASAGSSSSSISDPTQWTPLTIALQGTLQLSHIHLHTSLNVLFHTWPAYQAAEPFTLDRSRLVAATAYSVPNTSADAPPEGSRIFRNEPLTFTFNVGWVEGMVLPGMAGRPVLGVRDHGVGFTLFSFFALVAAAGVGAMGMLVYERRKSGRTMNGLLGGNKGGVNGVRMGNGYGGYGGYGGYASGKRD